MSSSGAGSPSQEESQDMTQLPQSAVIRPISGRSGAFELVLDDVVFPWHITREAVEVEKPFGDSDPWCVLHIGIIVGGPVSGAEAYNEYLAEEADQSRVRQADLLDQPSGFGSPVPVEEFDRLWKSATEHL